MKKEATRYHELKTWPPYFNDIFLGKKTFELRKNDRDYKEGDFLILMEYDPDTEQFTGNKLARRVTSIFEGGIFGLDADYVILSIQ